MSYRSGCLVCGGNLKYSEITVEKNCFYCNKKFDTDVSCVNGHFVCDMCHGLSADDVIEKTCIKTKETDPMKLTILLMNNKKINMNGPEHHFLVPAVLITCYYNLKKEYDKKVDKLKIARARSSKILGGFCGTHGVCGAAVGTGIFISLLTGANPLSKEEWMLSNQITSKSLEKIAYYGGPRCCKRNTFLAILRAVSFVKEKMNVEIPVDKNIICDFSDLNKECIKEECPFYPY